MSQHRLYGLQGGLVIDVFRLIDELEQLVENGKGRYFGRVIIDEEAFYVQTTKLRKSLPEAVKKATDVARNSENIMSSAESQATGMLGEAQQESERLRSTAIEETTRLRADAAEESQRVRSDARAQVERMIQNARDDHDRIVEEARREAERIEADARQHAEQLIAENSITQRAQQAAEEMHRQTVQETEDLRQQAGEWSMARLEQLEGVLQKLMMGVDEGKEQLSQIRSS